ncbi:hypothetical protein [Paenibacillus xylaniclasticus]|uniref:hypothetical protein n=1 Tax=Paenibacillus xylaniclasticus TaxID=588083 RepID=UPI000FDAC6C6|nr:MULTISPECIES: hypothetical protein [Paenibacillus]GFN32431.1 hypothetical protein PCURB6_26910 [Paenibacillus curdlanolyticus]
MQTKVISGFPGVGKTALCIRSDIKVLDSDSSSFSWISEGIRHPDFPNNYMQHIEENIGNVDYICVSSHDVVREALEEQGINYTLVYPDRSLKDEYMQRYRNRGSADSFVEFIASKWDDFIDGIEQETFPRLISLQRGQFLSDVLEVINHDM